MEDTRLKDAEEIIKALLNYMEKDDEDELDKAKNMSNDYYEFFLKE
jgi:hypothetical protein